MVVIAADHQINTVRAAEVLNMMAQLAAGDGHSFYWVVRVASQLIEKLPRLFLHHFAQIFHHRCGELVIQLRSVARVIKLTFALTGRAIDTAFLINT